MHATARRKRRRHETPIPEAGAVVVTTRDGAARWETRVEGGNRLDGWAVAASSYAEALAAHRGAVCLVRESARAAGSRTG